MLLVEDDVATSNALVRILSRHGCQVVQVQTIAEGAARLEEAPDVLVLDLMLPDGDGVTLLRFVREHGLPTRVIVTTGASDPARLNDVRSLSPTALLQKPINLKDLLQWIGTAGPKA